MNVLVFSDGSNDLVDISNLTAIPVFKVAEHVNNLLQAGIVEKAGENR